ncbi:hypothetical protein [Clostridium septicum]|uniref:Uncharacterized protein n=1 Tax=Clostridium septicum TaxID=1504 RepID=A0A9N7JPQ9_CLOSE|nr:hypothetical protein [Clostridium septicum]AYE35632.1 hypothetical protein CP523_14990 [Clostridium septicum]MDU1313229.1 hypothetical protein [Clostridium septicum]QAS61019.1 hypothetical protein EI377_09945 [Clostridium septicum]UEC19703.1 hypothetical protein LK444_09745 [Clostridium septicum]USS02236.1 hypothetical protein NH397_07430 [Clostridium septicum]
MKSYVENKNFIPKSYFKEKELRLKRDRSKGLLLLIILNIIVFPLTINNFFVKEDLIIEESNIEEEFSSEKIKNIISEIDKDIKHLKIKNGSGEILVNGKEKLYSIESTESFIIENIKKLENNEFLVSIRG